MSPCNNVDGIVVVRNVHRNSLPTLSAQMAGDETTVTDGSVTSAPLRLVRDVVRISGAGFSGFFKKDCTDLGRRVSLLAHLLEEIRDSKNIQVNCEVGSSSFSCSCFADLSLALQAAKRLVFAANNFDNSKFPYVSMLWQCASFYFYFSSLVSIWFMIFEFIDAYGMNFLWWMLHFVDEQRWNFVVSCAWIIILIFLNEFSADFLVWLCNQYCW